ncbi:hypothetical protein AB6A40_006305 [Gnathostoma spinigerum]|uniref:Cyclin N-terminal domain-containing protein n=1 Tax=Gnathostoma spinigerum TaxID=75299 RepID=A0ABD6EIN6_9BILA
MMAKNEVMVPAVPKSSASASVELAQEKSSTVANGEVSKEAVDKKSAKAIDFSKIKLSSFGQRRTHSQIVISPDAWLLTIDDSARVKLENPPSLSDGLDARTELDLRYLGCEIIQSGAIMLRLPQVAAATAQILYQRFYYQRSFVRHHFEYTVMACLLLASKIEEAPRRPRDVINVFHRLEHLHGKRNESKK